MQKERKKKRRLYACAELPVFTILTCNFFFDTGVPMLETTLLGNLDRMG